MKNKYVSKIVYKTANDEDDNDNGRYLILLFEYSGILMTLQINPLLELLWFNPFVDRILEFSCHPFLSFLDPSASVTSDHLGLA